MIKKQILYTLAYYGLVFFGVLSFWWLQSDEGNFEWEFFVVRLSATALIAFFITAFSTLFDRMYYNSQTLKKKFVLREGEQILGEYKTLQIRGFMPVLGKLILTSGKTSKN